MGTLFIISISLLAVANGALLTLPVIEKTKAPVRIAIGSVIGIAALSWIAFLTALALGLNAVSTGLTVGILAIGLVIQIRIIGRDRIGAALRDFEISLAGAIYYAAWTALLAWLFARVVMFYPDGMHTAPANNYGDLPFHFSAITSFAYGENLPPQTPIFAGMKFTYPFLIDYLTAFFIRCGADWRSAFFVENIALALALVCLIESLTLKIFNNTAAARLAPVIFLFNGGLGFINFFREFGTQSNSLFNFLWSLPKTYTMSDAGLALASSAVPLRWGNVFTTLLIPQRSMLFGLPIVAMIIALWWMACGETERRSDGATERQTGASSSPILSVFPSLRLSISLSPRRRYLLAAGILAGSLPMLHAHGFFSVMIASAPMFLLFRSIDWIAFFAPAAALAAPQAWYLSGTQVRNELFKWLDKWWEAGDSNPLLFWAVNAGIFILLLIAALLVRKITTSRQALFYLPFALWFFIPNLVSLAPWTWDNIKVLVYWSLASTPFVAMALAYLFARRFILARGLAIVLLLGLTFSGALDVTRALSPAENVGLFGQAELEVAALIREKTPPRSLILHAPIHNSVLALTGRQSVMGYPGHLWTHGIDYSQRELDVKTIYQGGPLMVETLSRLGIDYVIVGNAERLQLQADDINFGNLFPVVIDHAGYRVYQVKEVKD
ncbi:MAG TPA: hypothetical protein VJ810_06365 [Blastocatellia bacterium]|nr:hypothetical protein [Blastocatellia bacterium]